jgi:hypothetical protein
MCPGATRSDSTVVVAGTTRLAPYRDRKSVNMVDAVQQRNNDPDRYAIWQRRQCLLELGGFHPNP